MGEAPYVVTREGRPQRPVQVEQDVGAAFEVSVRLPFVLEHRYGPAPLRSDDGFEVPVGALYETDPDGSAATLRPLGELDDVSLAVAQVRLEHDADVGASRVLGRAEDFLEQGEGQVLDVVVLHVDVDECARFRGGVEHRFEAGNDGAPDAVG